MIKCIAFDADNTLYSTKAVARDADMEAMRLLAMRCGDKAEDLYSRWLEIVAEIKDSADPKIRHRLHSYGELCEEYGLHRETAEEMYDKLVEVLLNKLQPVDSAKNVLEHLKAKGITLWVITEDNKKMAEKKLEKVGFKDYFAKVMTADEAGSMKPSKKYYDLLARKFMPEEVLVVGDNDEKDLRIPRELGMQTLLATKPADLQKLLSL